MGQYEKTYQTFIDKKVAEQLIADNPFEGRYEGAKKTSQDRRNWYNSFTPEERAIIQSHGSTSKQFGPALTQHLLDEDARTKRKYGTVGSYFNKEGLRAKSAAAFDKLRIGKNQQGGWRTAEDFLNMPAYISSVGGRTAMVPSNITEGNYLEAATPIGEVALLTVGGKGGQQLLQNTLLPLGGAETQVVSNLGKRAIIGKKPKLINDLYETLRSIQKVQWNKSDPRRITVEASIGAIEGKQMPVTIKQGKQPKVSPEELQEIKDEAVSLIENYLYADTKTTASYKDLKPEVRERIENINKRNFGATHARYEDQLEALAKQKEFFSKRTNERLEFVDAEPSLREVGETFEEAVSTHSQFVGMSNADKNEVYLQRIVSDKTIGKFDITFRGTEFNIMSPKTWIPKVEVTPKSVSREIQLRNHTREELLKTALHETAHDVQTIKQWSLAMDEYSPTLDYWEATDKSKVGKDFKAAMVENQYWYSAVGELHAEVFAHRILHASKKHTNPKEAMEWLSKNMEKVDRGILKEGRLDKFFKKTTSEKTKRDLLKYLPIAIPVVGIDNIQTDKK